MSGEKIPSLKGVKIGNMGNAPAPTTKPAPTAQTQTTPVPQQKQPRQGKSEMEKIMDTTVKSAARSFGARLVTAIMKNIFKSKK